MDPPAGGGIGLQATRSSVGGLDEAAVKVAGRAVSPAPLPNQPPSSWFHLADGVYQRVRLLLLLLWSPRPRLTRTCANVFLRWEHRRGNGPWLVVTGNHVQAAFDDGQARGVDRADGDPPGATNASRLRDLMTLR